MTNHLIFPHAVLQFLAPCSKPIRRNCTKFLIFILGKIYIKKLNCRKPNIFYVEYSIGYAIEKGEVIIRSNNRCTYLAYIYFFQKLKFFRSESISNVRQRCAP